MAKHTGRKRTAGGLSKIEPFYQVYNRIRCRTTDPTNQSYKDYGGRGIKFLWKDYMEFKADMYENYLIHKAKYPKDTSLDRINNEGHYCKENCRWTTMSEQAKNKRTSRYITYKGEKLIIADWARRLGVPRQSIRYRLEIGMNEKDIIETPFSYKNKFI